MLGSGRARLNFAALVAALLVAGALTAGCGSSSSSSSSSSASASSTGGGSSKEPGTLVVNAADVPSTLDPAQGCITWDAGLVGSFYARLVQWVSKPGPEGTTQYDAGATPKPWLATSWKITDGGRTYTFKLHSGMKFPDGTPVDAQAVAYSINRTLTMGACGTSWIDDNVPTMYKSVTAPNSSTVVVKLNQPNANLLKDLASPQAGVVEPKIVEEHGGVKKEALNSWMAGHVAGYGPFLLKSYTPGTQLVMEANPNFITPPKAKKITVNFITSDATLLLDARSGAADITWFLSKQAASSLKGNSCCRVLAYNSPLAEGILLPWTSKTHPAFANVKFREALATAVPYEQIISSIAYGFGTAFYGPWNPGFSEYEPQIEKPVPYDLTRAKQLIAESGVKTPISFDVYVATGQNTEKAILTAIQAVWAQLGVNINIKVVSGADLITVLFGNAHDEAGMELVGPGVVAPDYYWDYDGECPGPTNTIPYTGTCIPAADKLIAKLRETTDPAKRKEITDQVARLWVEKYPYIEPYGEQAVVVLSKRVSAFDYHHVPDMRLWGAE
jgi:peptide/nickel transport system substrate-binding protein